MIGTTTIWRSEVSFTRLLGRKLNTVRLCDLWFPAPFLSNSPQFEGWALPQSQQLPSSFINHVFWDSRLSFHASTEVITEIITREDMSFFALFFRYSTSTPARLATIMAFWISCFDRGGRPPPGKMRAPFRTFPYSTSTPTRLPTRLFSDIHRILRRVHNFLFLGSLKPQNEETMGRIPFTFFSHSETAARWWMPYLLWWINVRCFLFWDKSSIASPNR